MGWWPVAVNVDEPFTNINRVYPTAQHQVEGIIRWAEREPSVKGISIFGSAITPSFHELSDIDVYVLCDAVPLTAPDISRAMDMWYSCNKDTHPIWDEIERTSIQVFQR